MVFFPPRIYPPLPLIPDDIPICDFMLEERHGRYPLGYSRDPFTCGITGKSYSWLEVRDRVDFLSRALAKEFGWDPNQGTEWDKVAGAFLLNTVSNERPRLQRQRQFETRSGDNTKCLSVD
jgi:hypothetical protein